MAPLGYYSVVLFFFLLIYHLLECSKHIADSKNSSYGPSTMNDLQATNMFHESGTSEVHHLINYSSKQMFPSMSLMSNGETAFLSDGLVILDKAAGGFSATAMKRSNHVQKRSIDESSDLRFRGCKEDHDPRIRVGLTSGDSFLCWYTKFCACDLDEEPDTEVWAGGGILFFKTSCCVNHCSVNFRIQAPVGYELVLEFLDMRISRVKSENSDGTHQCFDTNIFFQGDWYRFCGDQPPPPLRIMKRRVDFMVGLRHNSYCLPDNTVSFTLRYRACLPTDISRDVCPSQLVYTKPARKGYITSPGFEWVGNYPSNSFCHWDVAVEAGYAIRMYFEWFRFPGFGDPDVLKIYGYTNDAANLSDAVELKYQGEKIFNIPDYSIVLPGNTAVVEFTSDEEDSAKGFKIKFEAVDSSLYLPIVDELTFNCSGIRISSLPAYIRCNFRLECLDGRDEHECPSNTTHCGDGGAIFGHKCVYTYTPDTAISWEQAHQVCKQRFQGGLFAPDTIAEMDFVKNLIAKDFYVYPTTWYLGVRDYGTSPHSSTGYAYGSRLSYGTGQGSAAISMLYKRIQRSSDGITLFDFLGHFHSADVSSCHFWGVLTSNSGHHLIKTPCNTPYIPVKESGLYMKVNVVCQRLIRSLVSTPKPIIPPTSKSDNTLRKSSDYDLTVSSEHASTSNINDMKDTIKINNSEWAESLELFQCLSSKEKISATRRCDRVPDCFDGSDEDVCEFFFASALIPARFECFTGLTISYSHVCDGVNDCLDSQDEHFCHAEKEEVGKARVCGNGQAVDLDLWCDAKPDCLDGSDEISCEECQAGAVLCPGVGCYPEHWGHDDSLDCPFQDKDGRWAMEPAFIHHYTEGIPPPAIVLPDGYGKVKLISLSNQQEDSVNVPLCPATHAQCHGRGYCIPEYMLCNGVKDCPGGEDELPSTCQLFCQNRFRCHGTSICLHSSRLCDGWPHCPLHDDETLCPSRHERHTRCPLGCRCSSGRRLEMICDVAAFNNHGVGNESIDEADSFRNVRYLQLVSNSNGSLSEPFPFPISETKLKIRAPRLVKLEVAHSRIAEIQIFSAPDLYELDLRGNHLASVNAGIFKNTPEIRILDLSRNRLQNFNFDFLIYLRHIEVLDLSYNNLTSVKGFSFQSCPKLRHLLLYDMGIRTLESSAFDGLTSLQHLNLERNPVSRFGPSVLTPLTQLTSVKTDNFRLCCSQVVPESLKRGTCSAPTDEISSCEDILATEFFRGFLWVVAILTISGNGGVLVFRLLIERRRSDTAGRAGRHQQQLGFNTFITSLAASDLLMGIYLCIIGGADIHYRGRYLWAFSEWTRSRLCSFAGFLCFVSSEVSELIIALVTLDRFMALAFPLTEKLHFRPLTARLASLLAWTVGVSLATVPLLPELDDRWDRFYSQNSVCIPLPITRAQFPGKDYSFAVFVVYNLSVFLFIAFGQVLIFFAVRSNSMKANKKGSKRGKNERKNGQGDRGGNSNKEDAKRDRQHQQQAAIARKLALVVASDFLCWMPIGLLGLMSRLGVPVSGQANVAASVFLLPLNAALNPFLYTLGAVLVNRKSKKKLGSSAPAVKSRDRSGDGRKAPAGSAVSASKTSSTSSDKATDSSAGASLSPIHGGSTQTSHEPKRETMNVRLRQLEVWLALGKISFKDIQRSLCDFSRNTHSYDST